MMNVVMNLAVATAIQAAPPASAPIVTSPVSEPTAPATVIVSPRPRIIVPPVPPVVRARSTASLPTLFSTADYPQAALRAEQQGTVAVAIAVGREGRVTACDVTSSSGSAVLDATTCSILQRRARFTPARDAKGKIVEDVSSARIRWALPPAPPVAFADRYERLVMTLDGTGKAIKCRGEQSVDGPPPPPAVCEFGKTAAARIIAAADRDITFGGRELAVETGLRVGSSDAVLRVGRGAGERLVSLAAFDLEIDATGAVTRCDNADGFPEVRNVAAACARATGRRFAAAPGSGVRRAVLYDASYTRDIR